MESETLVLINVICTAVNALAVVVLVVVTIWYARSTEKMMQHVADQAKSVNTQSRLLALAAKIAATAPFLSMTFDEGGARRRLNALLKEVEAVEGESGGPGKPMLSPDQSASGGVSPSSRDRP